MGGGGGPTLKASLSTERGDLAGTIGYHICLTHIRLPVRTLINEYL